MRLRHSISIETRWSERIGSDNLRRATATEMTGDMDTIQQPAGPQASIDPNTWLDRHGDVLFQYALHRVRRRESAEELVQETLLAALRGYGNFEGRSSERTWLVAIMRRKITDYIRDKVGRNQEPVGEPEGAEVGTFDPRGKWRVAPGAWPRDPDIIIEKEEFWTAFDECFGGLSPSLANAFCLCELENAGSQEACKVLGISTSNLWTRLHRARLLLRQCLEINWFSQGRPRS